MITRRKQLVAAISASLSLALCLPAAAQVIDVGTLDSTSGFKVIGDGIDDYLGDVAYPIGDMNGDGFGDFLLGAPFAESPAKTDNGEAYVIYGRAQPMDLDTRAPGESLVKIEGRTFSAMGRNTRNVEKLDINGDGLSDLLVVGSGSTPFQQQDLVESYILFGSRETLDPVVDLDLFQSADGVRITGEGAGRLRTTCDVNGDGRFDFIAGDFVSFSPEQFPDEYVIAPPNGGNGFSISPDTGFLFSAGDVNGDGLCDLISSDPFAEFRPPNSMDRRLRAGRANVLLGDGAAFPSTLDADSGQRYFSQTEEENLGAVAGRIGDINGDGNDDFVLSGDTIYVVFGNTEGVGEPIDIADLDGQNGFAIRDAEAAISGVGSAFSEAGDFNGDGLADILVGNVVPTFLESQAAAFIIFGSQEPFPPELLVSQLDGSNGTTVRSVETVSDRVGSNVAAAGDVNGDGFDDVIIGGRGYDRYLGRNEGVAYVVLGGPNDRFEPDNTPATAGTVIIGGQAPDSFPQYRELRPEGDVDFVTFAGQVNRSYNIKVQPVDATLTPSLTVYETDASGAINEIAAVGCEAGDAPGALIETTVNPAETTQYTFSVAPCSGTQPTGPGGYQTEVDVSIHPQCVVIDGIIRSSNTLLSADRVFVLSDVNSTSTTNDLGEFSLCADYDLTNLTVLDPRARFISTTINAIENVACSPGCIDRDYVDDFGMERDRIEPGTRTTIEIMVTSETVFASGFEPPPVPQN